MEQNRQIFDNFIIGSCKVYFKSKSLGVSADGAVLQIKSQHFDLKPDYDLGPTVGRILINMSLQLSIQLLEISTILDFIFDNKNRLADDRLLKNLFDNAGELLLQGNPNAQNAPKSFRIPNAVLNLETTYAMRKTQQHQMQLVFDIFADPNGIFIEKIS
ncbi:MAG: hypothetical protein RR060_08355 [Victivallaceae bacterium]